MQIQRKVNLETVQVNVTENQNTQKSDSQMRKRDIFESSKGSNNSTLRDAIADAMDQNTDSASQQAYNLQKNCAGVEKAEEARARVLQKYVELTKVLIHSYTG